jgi:hypothetical protein
LATLIAVLGISFGQAAEMNGEAEKKFHHAVQVGDINTVRSMISADPALARSTDEYTVMQHLKPSGVSCFCRGA